MEDFELYEKIEAYLKGQLTPEETKAFENEIAQETDLAERVEQHRFEWDAMEILIEDDLRGKMAEWKADKDAETTPSVSVLNSSQTLESADEKKSPLRVVKGGTAMRRLYYALAAAASLALVVTGAWWLWHINVPKINQTPTDVVIKDTLKKTAPPLPSPQYQKPDTENNPNVEKENKKNESEKEEPVQSPKPLMDDKTYIVLATDTYKKSEAFSYQDEQSSRGDNGTDTTLDTAGKAYDKKDYTQAIALLKNTQQQMKTSSLWRYLLMLIFNPKTIRRLYLSSKTCSN